MVESKPSTNYERGAPENQTRITRKTGKTGETTTKNSRVSFLIPVNKGEVAVGVGEKRGYLF